MKVKVKIDDGCYLPERAYPDDAGMDLRTPHLTYIPAGGYAIINTGVHIEIPQGYVGMLKSKSGLYMKQNLTSEGVVDSGYNGSVVCKLVNHGHEPVQLPKGAKITQLVIIPILTPTLEIVDHLDDTERGANGFGSTGI